MNEDIFHLGIKAITRNKKGQILILENNPKNSSSLNPPHWDLPGGRLKKGDSIESTLQRELKEEIGIKDVNIIKFLDASISNFRMPAGKQIVGLILFTYLCSIKNPSLVKLIDDEHLQFKWANPKEAAKLLKLKFSKELSEKILSL
ncbi:hypothetical protein A2867_00730 [Candidatus Daviesbacteria bacterium RIFCSPHIGHO2_01_FULL_40_11]|uniref:Nudix hydrolase domain-containing protein n=1 Tax=Candidatus Daviesbacteria bacterium RIFCSPHIGHO2_01_FULL_40_11 TaxID=1797762 RepID=A0A1F5JLK4_9BACT|nr:MAG: hypothetical protein A2867_00730 [Candidatus Daviesbacteria bacterium RIFCSPHIGHO2_01_FULL_40_11]